MRVRFLLALSLTFASPLVPGHPGQALAQYRVQETPALNGLGLFLFKDIELRVDGGFGNTALTTGFDDNTRPEKQVSSQHYWGVFIDKPIVAHFLEMAYDGAFWQRDWVARDTVGRDLFFEPIRVVAYYREGDFHVSNRTRSSEYYIGARYSLDLGRVARHLPWFQK